MSQIDKMVDWCVKKAQRELDEGHMHRGLVKVGPDIETAKNHIRKAEHNLKGVESFKDIGFSDWSASAAFYSIYHCFLAILAKYGYESRNQECTIALILQLKEQGKIYISNDIVEALKKIEPDEQHKNTVIYLSENLQYGTETKIKEDTLSSLKKMCQKAIEEAKRNVY